MTLFALLLLSAQLSFISQAQDAGTTNFTAQYYNNVNFSGAPVFSEIVTGINRNYGAGSPNTLVPTDNFSILFSTTVNFTQSGTYRFTGQADDGLSVTINGTTIFDFLNNTTGFQERQADVFLNAGDAAIQVRYVERTGNAAVNLGWVFVGAGEGTEDAGPTFTPSNTPLPAIPPGALTGTVIRANVLNVRDVPSLGGNRINQILRGQTYQILGRDENARWFLLQLTNQVGWVYGYYIFVNGNEFNAPIVSASSAIGLPAGVQDTGVQVQTEAGLKLRAEPNTYSPQTGRITWGAFLPVVGRTFDNGWLQVVWKGTVGWIYSPFVEVIEGNLDNVPITR